MGKHFGDNLWVSAVKDILAFRRTDAKLMFQAVADGAERLTIEISCAPRCSAISVYCLVDAAQRRHLAAWSCHDASTLTF